MADDLSEEEKAERAREFRTTLNRRRPSRKRYSFSSPFLRSQSVGSLEADQSTAEASGFGSSYSPFTSTTSSGDQVPLVNLGGEAIYREISEKHSLSKWRNTMEAMIPQPIRKALCPPTSREEWKKFLFVHLPIIHWLWLYRPKQLIGDLVAGITIGVTHIPQGIGFALLANLPPVYGLYSSFIPVILYSIFGTSRHISVGTFPVVSLMVGTAVTRITSTYDYCNEEDFGSGSGFNVTMTTTIASNVSDPCAHTQCNTLRADIAISLSLLVGILMIGMGILRLGFITLFLSDALISGYTAAGSFVIFVTQLRFLFGLDTQEAFVPSGVAVTPRQLIKYFELIFTGHANGAAIVTSVLCILILIVLDIVNSLLRKYIRKIPIHIPAQLIVVILATGISFGAMLNQRYGLPIINSPETGGIQPGECFGVTIPNSGLLGELFTDAIVITIISFVINISQAKLLAKKNSYSIHPDQEFLAYGVMNLGGSFFGSFPTAGALSRTVLQDATGGNTQLVGFVSSAIVIVVILFLSSLFGPLPNATLASIVVVALKGLYFQVRDIYKFFKLSWIDMCVWLVVFLATLFIGLDIGLGVGVLFSLLVVILRTLLPFSPELGEARAWHYPPGADFTDEDFDEQDLKVYRVPRVYIFQFNAPLYFANVGVFRSRLYIETGVNPSEFEETVVGCFKQCCTQLHRKARERSPFERQRQKSPGVVEEDGQVYVKLQNEKVASLPRTSDLSIGDMRSLCSPRPTDTYHTIVIDCAPIGFADSMGTTILEQLVREYDAVGIQVLLASPTTPLCESLKRHGFFNRHSSERLFPSVGSAVQYAKDGNKVPALEHPEEADIALASNLERQLLYTSRPSLLEARPIELESRGRSPTDVIIANIETTV